MSGFQLPIPLLPGQGYTLTVNSVGWDNGRGSGGGRRGRGGRGSGGGRGGRGRGSGGGRGGRGRGSGGGRGGRGRGSGGGRLRGGIEKRNCYNCKTKGHVAQDCPFPKKSAVSTDAAPASSSNGAGSSVSSSTVASVAEQFKAMVMASSAPSPEAISAIRSAYEDELLQDEDEDEEMDFVFCA
ncbi:U3 small nucleolar RNA-associated protein 25-like [Folsomia candida]|uniref:U3 small nucleolar RNA-associated protein 25-like n=1 Tax=Folsomia candida TaxID=158441 RepID=UPI001604DAC9|nr:U3 small nucleolar RNA-associated protein 25-like [Folsomia candida]XP_035704092.1 U3 small nucleolar RNA-associated protein 25-like [Folsomia candida]